MPDPSRANPAGAESDTLRAAAAVSDGVWLPPPATVEIFAVAAETMRSVADPVSAM